jgi:hypothetical protein
VLSRSCRKKSTMRWRWRRVIRSVVGTLRFTTAGRSGRLAAGSRTSGRSNEDHATVDHWVPHERRARLDMDQMNRRTQARNMVIAAESAGLFFSVPRTSSVVLSCFPRCACSDPSSLKHRGISSNTGTASDKMFDARGQMTLSIRS